MCDFCNEFSGNGAGEFGRRHPRIETRVAWASDDLALLPTLGPLVPGHLLVLPREHFTAFACLPKPLRRFAEGLVLRLAMREQAAGRDLLWFEHGSSGPGSSGGCGIVHAHLHLLPVPPGWSRPALPPGFTFTAAKGDKWLDTPTPDSDYVLVGQVNDVWVAPVQWIPSQALRRWLAPALGSPHWDWRTSEPAPGLLDEVANVRSALSGAHLVPVG